MSNRGTLQSGAGSFVTLAFTLDERGFRQYVTEHGVALSDQASVFGLLLIVAKLGCFLPHFRLQRIANPFGARQTRTPEEVVSVECLVE